MNQKVKKTEECLTIEDIREQIDILDQDIINLFAKRFEFVKEIVKYKDKSEDAIIAQDRKDLVIRQRGEWAAEKGLDKDAYTKLFRMLVEHNISKELETLKNN